MHASEVQFAERSDRYRVSHGRAHRPGTYPAIACGHPAVRTAAPRAQSERVGFGRSKRPFGVSDGLLWCFAFLLVPGAKVNWNSLYCVLLKVW